MKIQFTVESKISRSARARQVEAMFDVPPKDAAKLSWSGNVPIEQKDWNIGLVVGPSGCGKTSVAREMFGDAYEPPMKWGAASVIDDVAEQSSVEDISRAFGSVGFNTVPAWLRPHAVLSNGEKFRVDLARRMLELSDPVVVDEFTSVVDRQVAKIGSHAVQKWVRRGNRKFVAVTCHHDVIDWLQPDWILEPATMAFRWRLLQQRPSVEITVARVDYSLWKVFAPYHYLTADLSKMSAKSCFALFVNGEPVTFVGVIHFPHPKVNDIKRISRGVTLPDWQGLGLIMVLIDALGAAYKAAGLRLRSYPAHPSLVRSLDRSKNWALKKKPGTFGTWSAKTTCADLFKGRPCAVFEFCGERNDAAKNLIQSSQWAS